MIKSLLIAGLLSACVAGTNDKPYVICGTTTGKTYKYKTGREIRRFYKGTVEFLDNGDAAILHIGAKDDFPKFKHGMIHCSRQDGQDIANLWLNNRQVKLKWVVDDFKAKPGSPHTVGTLRSWSP
jgi:hypothetical protein